MSNSQAPVEEDTATDEHITIEFVVPARNEAKHIQRCLESIESLKFETFDNARIKMTVVDNASTDETIEIAEAFGAKIVSVLPGNPGRARNAGVSNTDATFIAFIDADCILPNDWLNHCLQHLMNNEVAAAGAPQALAPDTATWVERVWVEMIVSKSNEKWTSVSWLPAFNVLLRRIDFETIGGFDETLQTCEDSDLSFRLSSRGELRCDHRVPVRHLGESKSLGEFFRREMWRSRGNFRSAWKRGSFRQEFISLFVPVGYLCLLLITLITLLIDFPDDQWIRFLPLLTAGLLLTIPVAIACSKRGISNLAPRSSLIATYLIARGLGPLVPAARVERKKSSTQK